jgi:predicted MFS family arabinose efflux permease
VTVWSAYRPLFAEAEARRLVALALVGRAAAILPELPIFVLAYEATGSYAGAGLALAARGAATAASAPLRGRLVDVRGASRALPSLVIVNAASLALLAATAPLHLGWAVLAPSALSGLTTPPLVAAMRLEWQRLFPAGDARRERAYAFESVSQIMLYVISLVLAGAGIAAVGAAATLAGAALGSLVGALGFAAQARAWPVRPRVEAPRLGPIRLPGVFTLVLVTALADVALGAVDVTVLAFAEEHGSAAAGGPLLAVFAASSVVGGSVYGAREWRSPPDRRLVALLAVAVVALAPLALASSVFALGCLLLVAGAPFAASWATASAALDGVAPHQQPAEAFNWLSTANAGGVAAGSALAGVVAEHLGTGAAFLLGPVAVGLAAGVAVLRAQTLSTPLRPVAER